MKQLISSGLALSLLAPSPAWGLRQVSVGQSPGLQELEKSLTPSARGGLEEPPDNLGRLSYQILDRLSPVLGESAESFHKRRKRFFTWLTRQTFLDSGAGRRAVEVEWLRERGADRAFGVDPHFFWKRPHLLKLRYQDDWPLIADQSVRIFTNFHAIYPESDDQTALARKLRRKLALKGLGMVISGIPLPDFEKALKAEGLLVSNERNIIFLVSRLPLQDVLRAIAEEAGLPFSPQRPPAAGLEEKAGSEKLKESEKTFQVEPLGNETLNGRAGRDAVSDAGQRPRPRAQERTSTKPSQGSTTFQTSPLAGANTNAGIKQPTIAAPNPTFKGPPGSLPNTSPAALPASKIFPTSEKDLANTTRRPSGKNRPTVSVAPPLNPFKDTRHQSTHPAENQQGKSAAGLEETEAAGRFLKSLLTPGGEPDPILAPFLREATKTGHREAESWVRAFLSWVRPPPEASVPERLLSVGTYRSGPFSRGELSEEAAREYLQEEWLAAIEKVLQGVAEQLGTDPEALGLAQIQGFMSDLFYAGADDGMLLMAPDQEAELYSWAYRQIPRLLVPRLAPASIDRERLRSALENPFRLSNDAGNDAIAETLLNLLSDEASGFRDDPAALRAEPKRHLTRWIRLVLALNLIDYSRPAILKEMDQEGGPAPYVMNRTETPFLEALGAERFVGAFIDRALEPNAVGVHLPDNNGELAGSLKLAETLLTANPTLKLRMILKADNGAMNDASVADAERLLREKPALYRRLIAYRDEEERFAILPGAPMHGTPLHLLSPEAVTALEDADWILSEGEANAWNLNGLAKEIYLGLRLKWPPALRRIFGLDLPPRIAAERPPAFFRIDGSRGPYYRNPYGAPQGGEHLTVARALAEQAGLEGVSPERFAQMFPEMAQRLPAGTDQLLLLPADAGTAVTLYRHETLAAELEERIAAQKESLAGIEIRQEPLPPTAESVRRPALFVLDALLTVELPYEPAPALRHWLGEPLPALAKLVAVALSGRADIVSVRVLGVLEREGRRHLVLAVQL